MSISALGSVSSPDASVTAYLVRQQRIARLEQQAAALRNLQTPVLGQTQAERRASATANANAALPLNDVTNPRANSGINENTSLTASNNTAVSADANTATNATNASANENIAFSNSFNNGLNGQQFSLLAAQYDVSQQLFQPLPSNLRLFS